MKWVKLKDSIKFMLKVVVNRSCRENTLDNQKLVLQEILEI